MTTSQITFDDSTGRLLIRYHDHTLLDASLIVRDSDGTTISSRAVMSILKRNDRKKIRLKLTDPKPGQQMVLRGIVFGNKGTQAGEMFTSKQQRSPFDRSTQGLSHNLHNNAIFDIHAPWRIFTLKPIIINPLAVRENVTYFSFEIVSDENQKITLTFDNDIYAFQGDYWHPQFYYPGKTTRQTLYEINRPFERWYVFAIHDLELPVTVIQFANLGLIDGLDYAIYETVQKQYLGVFAGEFKIPLEAGLKNYVIRVALNRPQIMATSLARDIHDLIHVRWGNGKLVGESHIMIDIPYTLTLRVPPPFRLVKVIVAGQDVEIAQTGEIVTATWTPTESRALWTFQFGYS